MLGVAAAGTNGRRLQECYLVMASGPAGRSDCSVGVAAGSLATWGRCPHGVKHCYQLLKYGKSSRERRTET